jgi:2-oxoglutarate dehydrogenase E2 component (dihydrolipoamide succinyltransferase)
MSTNVTMPQLGESVVEGTIAKWLVSEGDVVQEDQALVEVTTDKIDTEIPSPAAGVIGRIVVGEGETVKVGAVLCTIEPAAKAARQPRAGVVPGREAKPAREPERQPSPAAQGPAPASAPEREAARPAASQEPARRAAARGAAAAARGAAAAAQGEAAAAEAPARSAEAVLGGPATVAERSARERPGVMLDAGRLESARERRAAPNGGAFGDGGDGHARARVTPVVRRMMAEHDLDLSRIRGSGIGGRITKQDILEHLRGTGRGQPEPETGYGDLLGFEGPATAAPARGRKPAASSLREAGLGPSAPAGAVRPGFDLREYSPPVVEPGEGDRVEPFSKRRKIIAEHMVYSKAVSPHVYTMAEIDMSRAAALREANKRRFQDSEGVSLTYLHFVIAATCRALRDVPRLNAVVGDDVLILRRDVNIGIAVETEQGLVVPVIRNADRLALRGLAHAVEEMAAKARERRLRLEDLQGGTFTISNPGREGNLVGFAVINQPQLGILRMGEIKKRSVVVEMDGADVIAIRPIMLMSLSYDHRVIDGVTGNSFLYRVKEYLERAEFEI